MSVTSMLSDLLHSAVADRALSNQMVLTFAHFLWQGTAVAALVLILATLAGRSVQRRYLISTCGFLMLAICPVLTFVCLDEQQSGATTPALPIAVADKYEFDIAFDQYADPDDDKKEKR